MDNYQWLCLIFFSAFIYLLLRFKSSNKRKTSPPFGPNSGHRFPIIGHIPQFFMNRHRFLDWTTDLLAASATNTIKISRPNQGLVITANPANLEYILKINCQNYPKGPVITSALRDFLGGGIFDSDGEHWKVQRKAASFEFNNKSLRAFVVNHVKHEISTRLIPLLKKYASMGEVLDLQDVFERFAMDSACRLVFGEAPASLEGDSDVSYYSSSFADAFKEAEDLSAGRFYYAIPSLWKLKKGFDIGSEHRLRCSIERVHNYAMDIVRLKKKKIETSSVHDFDLLSRFITSGQYSDAYLRDVIVNFILAGRETISSAMTWFFWLLSQRPDVNIRYWKKLVRYKEI